MISDSNKEVDTISDPMAETHIVYIVRNLSFGVGLSKPAVIRGGIGTITNVLENSRMVIYLNSLSPLNMNT